MFIDKNNYVYANPNKYLKYKNQIGFKFKDVEDSSLVSEYDLDIHFEIKRNYLYYGNGFRIDLDDKKDKGDFIKFFIKLLYSNDDQIAIMLNKESGDLEAKSFYHMQKWRIWSKEMAKKCFDVIHK